MQPPTAAVTLLLIAALVIAWLGVRWMERRSRCI